MDLAKDMVQDTFASMWQKRETVSRETSKQYLFASVVNKSIDYYRYKGKYSESDVDTLSNTAVSRESAFETKALVKQAMGKLTELQRQLVLLKDLEGFDYAEIGKMLQLSESQVKVYLFRARKALKEIVLKLEETWR